MSKNFALKLTTWPKNLRAYSALAQGNSPLNILQRQAPIYLQILLSYVCSPGSFKLSLIFLLRAGLRGEVPVFPLRPPLPLGDGEDDWCVPSFPGVILLLGVSEDSCLPL